MQITSGIRSALSNPSVYSAFQYMMGARSGWKRFVREYMRAVPGDVILDVGCGPADILDYLPTVDYWGFDISPEYIASATRKYGNRGHFQCKLFDSLDLGRLPACDFVVLSGVLHHLEDSEASELLALASRALKKGGKLVTIDPCVTPKQNPIARYLINKDRGQNVRDEAGYKSLVKGNLFNDIEIRVVNKAWIPYTHCYMVCTH